VIGLLAAAVLSASDATPPKLIPALVAAKKKKKKSSSSKSSSNTETSEGIDLTASEPVTKTPESTATSDSAEPVAEGEVKKEEEASDGDGPDFSVVTATTNGEGSNVIEAAVGWPGVYAGFWRGLLSNIDVGARVQFNWSPEGQLLAGATIAPGFKGLLLGRMNLVKVWKADVGVEVAPGFVVYLPPGVRPIWPGVFFSVAGLASMNVMEKLNVGVRLETGVVGIVGLGATIPIFIGGGAEYALTEQILLQARLKVGAGIWTNGIGAAFAFEGLLGAAYKL
jgi:hypothetical protein